MLSEWIAKLIYSAVLVGVLLALGSAVLGELHKVWLDKRLYFGKFRAFEKGVEKPSTAQSFVPLALHHHKRFVRLLEEERALRRHADSKAAWLPRDIPPIPKPADTLSQIELSVQGINITQVLTSIRKWVTHPNEIYGTIDQGDEGVTITAEWPKGPEALQLIRLQARKDMSDLAFQLACRIVWADAIKVSEEFDQVDSEEFCSWSVVWTRFVSIRRAAHTADGLSDTDIAEMKKLRDSASRAIDRGAKYPEMYRLRAEVTDLLNIAAPAEQDLVAAQRDWLRYSTQVDPELREREVPTDELVLIAAARARPAIRVQDGKISEGGESWERILAPHANLTEATARATGLVRRNGKMASSQTGFAIGEGLILTTLFPVPKDATFPLPLPAGEASFIFADDVDNAPKELSVEAVVFSIGSEGGLPDLALLQVVGHDTSLNPPLTLSMKARVTDPAGRFGFVVGYGFPSSSLPQSFTKELLGDAPGRKRLFPGRMLSVEAQGDVSIVTSDISTTPGSAGGPLIDLETGEVIGIHRSGRWDRARNVKFADAQLLSSLLEHPGLPPNVKALMLRNPALATE